MGIQRPIAAADQFGAKDWGCECIFFFNYNRITWACPTTLSKQHMDALFGEERADNLRARLEPMRPAQRELTIVEEICEALVEMGGKLRLLSASRMRKAAAPATT